MTRATVAAVVFITLVWGLNWPMMKFSLREITPLYFRAITMTGGVLLLVAWLKLRGTSMAMTRPQWRAVAWLALPNVLGWHLFSILGVQALASGRAATLGFTMPIWTLLLGALFFGQRLNRRGIVAAVCAATAVALLVADEFSALAGRPVGIAWMQVAAISWALGTLMLRRTPLPLPTDVITDVDDGDVERRVLGAGRRARTRAVVVVQCADVGCAGVGRGHQLRARADHLVRAGAQACRRRPAPSR